MLYVRGREMRLHQELVLGVGGVRAIRALGIEPAVWHLNEGHSAFLLAERARELVAKGATLDDAWDGVRRDSVFTIHTPVSAGNERFDADLVRRVAGPLLERAQIPVEPVLELGLGVDRDPQQFDMTAFSLRLTNGANAVSQLHAETANATWNEVAPREILGMTNGVHGPSWVGAPIADLLERYLDVNLDDIDEASESRRFWERLDQIPAKELWEAHTAPEARAGDLRPRPAAQPVRPPRRGSVGPRRARVGARPRHPDDRLRAALRDLQARRPALPRHRPACPPVV